MEKYLAIVVTVAMMLASSATQAAMPEVLALDAQGVQWETDYGKALRATRADDRPLLVVLESPTEGNQAIKQVAHTETVSQEREAELLSSYQLCRIDVTTDYGKKVAGAFKATSFPHTSVIDKTGSVVIFAKTGQLADSEWMETLATYKHGNRSDAILAESHTATSHVVFRRPYSSVESTSSFGTPTCTKCQRNGNCPNCQ